MFESNSETGKYNLKQLIIIRLGQELSVQWENNVEGWGTEHGKSSARIKAQLISIIALVAVSACQNAHT